LSQYNRIVSSPLDEPLPWVDRWLRTRGKGLPPLSWDAARLLDQRLAVRRPARAVTIGGHLLSFAAMIMAMRSSHANFVADPRAAAWLVTAYLLFSVTALVQAVVVRRGERRVAATLSRRVSRDSALTPWQQLGSLRSASCLLLVAGAGLTLDLLVRANASPALIVAFALTAVFNLGIGAVAFVELTRAAAIALDAPSLAVDRRLRCLAVSGTTRSVGAGLTCLAGLSLVLDGGHGSPAMFDASFFPVLVLLIVTGLDDLAMKSDARGPLTSGPEGAL
jgi:hypothetical protein